VSLNETNASLRDVYTCSCSLVCKLILPTTKYCSGQNVKIQKKNLSATTDHNILSGYYFTIAMCHLTGLNSYKNHNKQISEILN